MDGKTCFKCGVEQPRTEFYKHSRMGDGLLGKCKGCARADSRERRARKIDEVREYDRNRPNKDERSKACIERARRNPAKARARRMVHLHVKRGNLTRKPCEVCAAEPADAHHDDYTRPLDVRWLCRSHHRQWHVENGPGKVE